MVRTAAPAIVVLFAVVVPARALAADNVFDDPYRVPAAPRPPTLPELTHAETEATLEATAGAILPNAGGEVTHAYVQRLALELPVGLRRWYVGANYELAAADGRAVSGNLEIGGRSLWATPTGLAFGGGLELIVPTAQFDESGPAAKTALDAASLRPWDVAFFVPGGFGARPFIDVRAIDGQFVVQFRQALDLMAATRPDWSARIYATLGVYLGLWATREIAAGIEAFESYAIVDPNVTDGTRAAVVISPNVRLVLPWVEPAISAFTNIGTPLQGASDRIWGFRVAFTAVYDPSRALRVRTKSAGPEGRDVGPDVN
ncbi:MAG TPA: hypothetical protein VK762_10135 [Polyangiaceae bacterium]|nr:hypothetical protein [Polyangiaceae bacterium]